MRRPTPKRDPLFVSLIISLLFASACGRAVPVTIHEDCPKLQDTDGLSDDTRQVLKAEALTETWTNTPDQAIAKLDQTRRSLLATAELALHEARRLKPEAPDRALQYAVFAARRSFGAWPSQPQRRTAIYNQATGISVDLLSKRRGQLLSRRLNQPDGSIELLVDWSATIWSNATFDHLYPAPLLEFEGLRQRHRRPGVGACLVAVRRNRLKSLAERYRPPEGIIEPLTATLEPEDSSTVRLRLFDPRRQESVFGQSLAADFTAPYALLMHRAQLEGHALSGLFSPDQSEYHRGFFMLEPYSPDKIPLIMVHGVYSSPLTWRELSNDLWGDPEFRRRYQIWHYMYPSGFPVLLSSLFMRRQLEQLCRDFDPRGQHAALKNMVIVGHSMGGLVSKPLMVHSGDEIWKAFFKVPAARLEVSPKQRRELEAMLNFQPNPRIRRAIFIAVPHRGSEVANTSLASFVSRFITKPKRANALYQLLESQRPELNPKLASCLNEGFLNGISSLSSKNPVTQQMARLPVVIPFHSIIGDREPGPPVDDGYVRYQSAHLKAAQSELVIPSDHSVQDRPEGIAEVKRILLRHAGS